MKEIITLENEFIKAAFSTLGAETISIFDKINLAELLWQPDSNSWTGQAPVLFPIVGRLKKTVYLHNGKEYSLPTHGFARNSEFEVLEQSQNSITFLLRESEKTFAVYPFKFNLCIKYEIKGDRLITDYQVINTDNKMIYFGIGGHPGFNLPHTETEAETVIDGNSIIFEHEEKPERICFDEIEHLVNGRKSCDKFNQLDLTKKTFAFDAILFENVKSEFVTLKRSDGINIRFWHYNVPYLAFWTHAKKGAYICIEPWCGLPDSFEPVPEIKNKAGINSLKSGEKFNYRFDIELLR